MSNIFTGSEIIELGILIEKNGWDFYTAVSARAQTQKAKDVFEFLAGEEQKHIAIFKKMLESVRHYEPPEAYEEEYLAYMNALAGDYVFTKNGMGSETAKNLKTDKAAIEAGIGFEKESILFYEGMKKIVPEFDFDVLDELIGQEQGHLARLAALRQNV